MSNQEKLGYEKYSVVHEENELKVQIFLDVYEARVLKLDKLAGFCDPQI